MRVKVVVSCVVLLCFLAAPAFSIGVAEPVTGFFSYVFGLFSYADDAPEITDAFLNQYKFVPGDYMLVTARVVDDQGVEEVKAEIEHDAGVDVVNMVLVTGDKKEGTYQGQWVVHDCSARSYDARIVAVDSSGQESYKVLVWEDPLVCNPGHRAEDVCPGEFGGNATGAGLKDYSFPSDLDVTNDLNVNQGITLGGVKRTSWPSESLPPNSVILRMDTTPPAGFSYTSRRMITDSTWTDKAQMPTNRNGLAAAEVNGRTYVIGGFTAGPGVVATNEEYDPATNTWTTKASMPTARYFFVAAAVNGKIYAIGGMQIQTENEEYDPATDTWATKAPMPTGRSRLAIAVNNGKLYLMGGAATWGSPVDTNEEYDPITDTWTTKTPLPTERSGLAAAAVDGKIYVIGGLGSKNEEYNPITDTWATKTPMPTARNNFVAAAVNNKIYAIGGGSENEEYDPSTDTWIIREQMPTARSYLAAAVVNGKIYVIGGNADGNENEEFTPPITYYLMSKD